MFTRPSRIALHEIFHQHRDVLFPFAERGHFYREDVEAIKQIPAETPIRDGGVQVTIRGRNQAHVHVNRLDAADALEFPFLQHAQQRDLRVGQEFADFVQEDGAPVRQFEPAQPALHRAGEGAFLMAE